MEEITSMTKLLLLKERNKQLQKFLSASIAHFRNGEDTDGIEGFLSGMEELERVVEIDQDSQQPKIDMNQLLPLVRELYFYIQNQDITGITDLLEYTVYPLTEEWLKGLTKNEYC